MADEPVTAWREPSVRKLLRWLTRHRTSVTGAAAALLVALVGLGAVAVVQAKANAELTQSRAAVQARYDLAVVAIKTFHTGVSEDFLLKQDQFKELRDRLLRSAAEFYGRLSALLGKETDVASRRALAQSNYELAGLTARVGRREDALAAHRAVLAAREALAAEPGAGARATLDLSQSLVAIAELLDATGKADDALATYTRAEGLLAGPANADPEARAALASCRSSHGYLLSRTGKAAEALASYRLARDDQEVLVKAASAAKGVHLDLADTLNRIGLVLKNTGQTAEAEAEYRGALVIYQKLADDNPTVIEFQSQLRNAGATSETFSSRRASVWKRRPSTARRWQFTGS